MKKRKVLLLGALCAALPTAQTKCAAEADPGVFDVKGFVQKVEHGELTDEQISPNLNRQNPLPNRKKYRIKTDHHNPKKTIPPVCVDTPPINAVWGNHLRALATFLRLGADLEKADIRGRTPLMLAGQQGRCAALKMLLEAKANVEAQDLEGLTPLMIAAHFQCLEAVEILMETKADPNTLDKHQQTALTHSINGLYPGTKIAEFLLEAKANPAIPDVNKKTALAHAKEREKAYPGSIKTITKLLIAATPQSEEEAQEAEEDRLRREELLANHRAAAEVKEENA